MPDLHSPSPFSIAPCRPTRHLQERSEREISDHLAELTWKQQTVSTWACPWVDGRLPHAALCSPPTAASAAPSQPVRAQAQTLSEHCGAAADKLASSPPCFQAWRRGRCRNCGPPSPAMCCCRGTLGLTRRYWCGCCSVCVVVGDGVWWWGGATKWGRPALKSPI